MRFKIWLEMFTDDEAKNFIQDFQREIQNIIELNLGEDINRDFQRWLDYIEREMSITDDEKDTSYKIIKYFFQQMKMFDNSPERYRIPIQKACDNIKKSYERTFLFDKDNIGIAVDMIQDKEKDDSFEKNTVKYAIKTLKELVDEVGGEISENDIAPIYVQAHQHELYKFSLKDYDLSREVGRRFREICTVEVPYTREGLSYLVHMTIDLVESDLFNDYVNNGLHKYMSNIYVLNFDKAVENLMKFVNQVKYLCQN